MRNYFISSLAILIVGLTNYSSNVQAQTSSTKADRTRAAEQQRLERVDPPVRPDPLGNALIGGAVTGSMKGAAAGAAAAAVSSPQV